MSRRPSGPVDTATDQPGHAGRVHNLGVAGQASHEAGGTALSEAVEPDTFRRAMAAHAAGVVVVTAQGGESPVGLTATSFTSVSVAPPLVSFYVGATASSWPGIRDASVFAVNVLDASQQELATRFATSGVDRFAPPTRWRAGPEDVPLLDGAIAHILCRRHDILAVGDHWLVVGRVTGAAAAADPTEPLLYHRGAYGRLHRPGAG